MKREEFKTVRLYGVDLLVYYKEYGFYRMATLEDPEEFPDIVITKITVHDSSVDIMDILEPHMDYIYELLVED